jgi:hypothetical protein
MTIEQYASQIEEVMLVEEEALENAGELESASCD